MIKMKLEGFGVPALAGHTLLSAGGRKYDDVTQVSKPAVSPTSQSADRPLLGRLRIWKSARQQVWKPALQNTSPNLRPGALRLPVLPNYRVGTYYLLGAISLLCLAWWLRAWSLILLWPAASLAIVASAYFGFGPGIYRKTNGRLPLSSRIVLAPILLGQQLS